VSGFEALYPKPILRLAAEARGAARLTAPDLTVTLVNPLCGDKIVLDLEIEDERVTALGYEVKACVLCQASASVLAGAALGFRRDEAEALKSSVKMMLQEAALPPPGFEPFTATSPHKSRHACVLLPLDALIEGLEGIGE
jgi:NifU-like protein involved in Fe-S cluster formation